MKLLHTKWIKPSSKKQATWIADYLNKKNIFQCPKTPKLEADLARDIRSGFVANNAQRKKMESAWRSHVSRSNGKKNQKTISISKENYEAALKQKRARQSVSTYIESLINRPPSSILADL